MQAVTWLTISGAFVMGVLLALLGSLKLTLVKRLGIGETRIGGLVSAFHLTLIPMMLLSGILIDQWGLKAVLMLGCLMTAVGLAAFTIRDSYAWAVLVSLVLGAGAACLSTATVVLMPRAFFGENEHVTASLNLGNVFFALGALVTPTLTELLLRTIGFRRTLSFLALICLVPAFIAPFSDLNVPQQTTDLENVLDRQLLMAALVFALYAPVEFCLATWCTTYLTRLGQSERQAAWVLSAFWFAFLAGRVTMAFVYSVSSLRFDRETAPWAVFFLSLGAAVVLGNLAGAVHSRRTAVGIVVSGFLLGPIFPTLVGVLFTESAFEQTRATAYGAMFAIGSLGSLLMGPLIGSQVRRRSVEHALRIPLLIALLLVCAAFVLALMRS